MIDEKFHRFSFEVKPDVLPSRFTFPFNYIPHHLCVEASNEVMNWLEQKTDWHKEISLGKMFGVLVVKSSGGEIGFLAAFSGNICHSNNHPYFVGPVYDLLNPDGFFRKEENNISAINVKIKSLEGDREYKHLIDLQQSAKSQMETCVSDAKKRYEEEKENRKLLREQNLTSEELDSLLRTSQFQKAELRRLKLRWNNRLEIIKNRIKDFEAQIKSLKDERKTRSARLQKELLDKFEMLNAKGEKRNLNQIFAPTTQGAPPAGAGECAGPKLLQYAYVNGYTPIAMAEFWWGNSPKTEIRNHGCFYPACRGKCLPILSFMMEGLEVDNDPLECASHTDKLEILYEDEDIIAIDKPANILSVHGKLDTLSVPEILQEQLEISIPLLSVHRLDYATSGVLLLAKNKEAHKNLQAQFADKTITKVYIAELEGNLQHTQGVIDLPLTADLHDRPRQKVDYENGKKAITHYKVLSKNDTSTRIEFYPLTGRTHQLRVHSAHKDGLNMPIKGDTLYGSHNSRLFLHAFSIRFKHPRTNIEITIEAPIAF